MVEQFATVTTILTSKHCVRKVFGDKFTVKFFDDVDDAYLPQVDYPVTVKLPSEWGLPPRTFQYARTTLHRDR
jgi:hypothetical protein